MVQYFLQLTSRSALYNGIQLALNQVLLIFRRFFSECKSNLGKNELTSPIMQENYIFYENLMQRMVVEPDTSINV